MAVSPRLARKFQQTLGSDAAEDLVGWMQQVDSQGEAVRALIAKMGEWREASRADLAELRQEMRAGDSALRVDLANARADLIKWSFVFWITTQITVVGALIALSTR